MIFVAFEPQIVKPCAKETEYFIPVLPTGANNKNLNIIR